MTPSVPMVHVTVPASIVQVPCEADADVAVTPAGSVSVITTPVAGFGPAFCAVST